MIIEKQCIKRAISMALEVERIHKQAALNIPIHSEEDGHQLREAVMYAIIGYNLSSSPAIKHVEPWLWRGIEKTKGPALSFFGEKNGFEIRLSPHVNVYRPCIIEPISPK